MILVFVGFVRELFGAGTLFGIPVVPSFLYELGYQDIGLMVYAPSAFIVIGIFAWLQYELSAKKEER